MTTSAIAQPITIHSDTATWTLQSGNVRLAEPTGGRITGLVFEGQGRFTMTIPDGVELAQVRRFAQRRDLQSIEEPFTELLFRTSADTINRLFPDSNAASYSANSIAGNRQNHWLIDLRTDIDARIIAALLNPAALQISAAVKTGPCSRSKPRCIWLSVMATSVRSVSSGTPPGGTCACLPPW